MTRAVLAVCLVASAALALGQGQGLRRGQGPGTDQPAHPLVRRVLEMAPKVKLAGTRVVQHLEAGQRRLVTERVLRDGLRLRSEVVGEGPLHGQVSVENRGSRRVWNPKLNEIREVPSREAEAIFRLARLLGRGRGRARLTESDGGAVAGVPTRQLELKMPNGNVVARAWIDPGHGALLKMQTFDPKGQLNGAMEFTAVRFNPPIPEGSFELNKPGARVVTVTDELRQACRELGFRPMRLPAEWRLVAVRKMQPKGVKVLMQSFTNGRARVSLFQIQGEVNAERLARLAGDRTNSHVWNRDAYRVALIGEMAEEDLRRLADQVTG